MSQKLNAATAVIGIDIGKNSFHIVGHDHRGAIVLRQKWSRGQVETRLANLPPCLIGMEDRREVLRASREFGETMFHEAIPDYQAQRNRSPAGRRIPRSPC
jgi:hypothetical protein